MNPLDLFYMGSPLFMSIITIWGVGMLIFSTKKVVHLFVHKTITKSGLGLILLFGSLAVVTGLLAQAIGLMMAFNAIQVVGDVSPALLAGGLRASLIAPVYGLIIFVLSLIIWGVLKEVYQRKLEANE